jgi:hypothetical protein
MFRVRDDAGRVVRLHGAGLGAALWLAARRSRGRRTDIALRALLRVVKSGRLLSVIGTTAMVIMIGVLIVSETAVGIWMLLFSPIFSAMLVAIAGFFVAGFAMSDSVGRMGVRAMLARQRCPSCNYDLRSLGVGQGRVVCPECASAWSGAGLGREAPVEPEQVIVKWADR